MKENLNTIPIFFTVDDKYVPFLAVALQSLIENSSEKNYYLIKILYTSITEENQEKIKKYEKENVNIEIPITSLKQFIDFYFARTVSRDVNLLKICKFCNKAFIANNPKAEYDTPQCKNKANVYKSRAKNK